MANYDPATARIRVLYQRRRITGADVSNTYTQDDNNRYIYDRLPYYQICFNVDQPGEPQWFFEFWPTEATSITGDTTNGRDLVGSNYPIAEIRIVDGQPNPDVFQAF